MMIIPKFKNLIETMPIFDGVPIGQTQVTMSNIDDIFRVLKQNGINKIKVDWEIMLMVALFALNNIGSDKSDKWEALKIIREGKIDKFLGIDLILEE